MQPLQIAVATRCFGQPFKQVVQTAADMDAQGVQFNARNELNPSQLSESGRRHFLHQLEELHLSVASLYFPTRRTYYNLDELDARIDATKMAMQFAFQLKSRVVTAHIGRIPTDFESEQYRLLIAVLNDLARYSNHVGATFCITPTNDSPETLVHVIDEITEGLIGIDFDPAVFIMTGHDPTEAFRMLHKSILHITVRDAIRDIDGSGVEVPLGRGEVESDELLAMVDQAGYAGWMTVMRTTGNDPVGDITRAIQYLRQVALR